jgi:hypothetical protein
MKVKEIAKNLGMTETAVNKVLQRAQLKFARNMFVVCFMEASARRDIDVSFERGVRAWETLRRTMDPCEILQKLFNGENVCKMFFGTDKVSG